MNAVARQVKVYSKENKLAANEVLNFTVKTVVLGDESNDFWNDVSSGINFIVKKNWCIVFVRSRRPSELYRVHTRRT